MRNMRTVLLMLTILFPVTLLGSSPSLAETKKIEATIFSYDGQDFVRTTTSLGQEGKSVANTKLDRSSPAYSALTKKQSYAGPATLFGKDYDAKYAPLVGNDGKLTGALFVGVPK
ncbi:MAG: Cache 3/Cache 2 fusion domain-containing protein [Hyphomicrobium sp.]|jgi:hypothetical protein